MPGNVLPSALQLIKHMKFCQWNLEMWDNLQVSHYFTINFCSQNIFFKECAKIAKIKV